MTLKADDLVCYAAVGMPENDFSGINGGGIGSMRVDWGDVADSMYEVTGVPGDSPVAFTVRHASGHKQTITHVGGGTFDFGLFDPVVEVLKVESNKGFAEGGSIGSITVGVPLCTMKTADTGITKVFIEAFANNEFGGAKTYYNKIFWCNKSGTDTLFNALVQKQKLQIIIPPDLIQFALVASINDLSSTINRLTGPDSTIFGSGDRLVPGLDLQPGDHIGVWLSMKLDPNQMPGEFTYKSQCTGQTATPS